MAKFESKGYCPCNSVASLISEVIDKRLTGLWSLIGASVVCINESDLLTVDGSAVDNMFSKDPIAYPLMEKIIRYNVNAEKISVYQDHTKGCLNMQSFETLYQTLTQVKNPVPVVAAESKYTVIICEDKEPNTIAVRFWDLTACW